MSTRRTYYAILGVERGESLAGVRSAFRELARRYHPDRVGPRGTAFFQEIVEAYRTLSDPRRRADYNRGLEHVGQDPPPTPTRVPSAARPEAEPLIPEPLLPQPVSLLRDFEVGRPSVDEIFDRIRQSFEARQPKSRQLETLEVEVVLRPETAFRGGVLTIGVPVFYPCPRCGGMGSAYGYNCLVCGDRGLVEDEQPLRLRIPPGVPDGASFRVPLGGLGIHGLQLVVRIRVTKHK